MIRIKVKTLAIGSVAIILLLIAAYSLLPSLLVRMEKYDSLLAIFPGSKEAPEALYWAAETTVPNPEEEGRIFIFHESVSYSNGSQNSREQLNDAQGLLERLIDGYPDYRHIDMARSKLAQIYLANGELDQAEPLFREIETTAKDEYRRNEAKTFADLLASRRSADNGVPSLTGSVRIGDSPAADTYVVLRRKSDNGWYSKPYGHYPMAMTDRNGEYRFYDISPDEYEVGVGVTAAEVDGYFLTDQDGAAVTISAASTASYDIRFVPKVNIVSPTNKEETGGADADKIRFAWEPYPGASGYKLSITALERDKDGKVRGTFTVTTDELWREPNAEYDVRTLRTYPRGTGKSGTKDEVWLSTSGILGTVYPGGDFIWSVDAYDKHGKRISSSSGYYLSFNSQVPFFSVDDALQLEGDKLVLQGDYEGAIKAYEGEPNNPYALRALALLWMNGFTSFEDRGDKAKALTYLLKIPNPVKFDYELMQLIYEELGNKAEAEKIREKLEGLGE